MTGYLLDTNIPSEFSRDLPEPRVVQWLKAQPVATLFLSVVTIGEIRKGLIMLPPGRRRTGLETWFQTDLLTWFRNRNIRSASLRGSESGGTNLRVSDLRCVGE